MKELTLLVSTSTVQSLYWGVTFMKELTLLVSTSTVPHYWVGHLHEGAHSAGEYLYCPSLLGGHLHEGAHSAGEYLYCTVTLLGGHLHEGAHPGVPRPVHKPGRGRGLLLLLVSTSTVQSLYWEVTFMKELTLAGEYLYCTVTQWGDTFTKEFTLQVSTSTVQSLYWGTPS